MLKTNKFKTLVVLIATILGLTGMTSNVYADKVSDKKTIEDMALTFVRYTTYTDNAALDWAERNTTGKAYADPYRFGAPGKNRLFAFTNQLYSTMGLMPMENDPKNNMKLTIKQVSIRPGNTYVIVQRKIDFNANGTDLKYGFLHKVWFKKVKGAWKISDYYILANYMKVNGKMDMRGDGNFSNGISGNPWGFDSKGAKFPY